MSTPTHVSVGAGLLLCRTPSQANLSTPTPTSRPSRGVPVTQLATPPPPTVGGGGVAKCVTGTPRDGRDVGVGVDRLAWDGVRQRRTPAPTETCVGVLITRRSQVQILPPLPT